MQKKIKDLLLETIKSWNATSPSPSPTENVELQVEHTRQKEHGDFACNVAFLLAKTAKKSPRDVALQLLEHIPAAPWLEKVQVAGPGFLNFFLKDTEFQSIIPTILQQKHRFGRSDHHQGKRVHIEFVSSNPTGPLHVGHGRGAAFGACCANLLEAVGYFVHREYYVNDAGRQMRILALSIWLRYLQQCGEDIALPVNAYQGSYVIDIAQGLARLHGKTLHHSAAQLQAQLPSAETPVVDKEASMDALIQGMQHLLGDAQFKIVHELGLNAILKDMQEDLAEFGVVFDAWFHESQLINGSLLTQSIEQLQRGGYTYEKDGALWFRATDFEDEKDRVLIRSNGQPTYFASDVAYHLHKYQQNYDRIIDVFGADHHGYIPRVRSFLKALGEDPEKLTFLTVQFAILYRGNEKIAMSTRSGEFVTLRELRKEVGNDAARFFYIMRKPEQHLDFDLELAKSKSNENPVYYIQYAHARIASVLRQMQDKQLPFDLHLGLAHLEKLCTPEERDLLISLQQYPAMLLNAADAYAPHTVAHYLHGLAAAFHSYYNAHTFLSAEAPLRDARLCLIQATQYVLAGGLGLLGVSAPDSM